MNPDRKRDGLGQVRLRLLCKGETAKGIASAAGGRELAQVPCIPHPLPTAAHLGDKAGAEETMLSYSPREETPRALHPCQSPQEPINRALVWRDSAFLPLVPKARALRNKGPCPAEMVPCFSFSTGAPVTGKEEKGTNSGGGFVKHTAMLPVKCSRGLKGGETARSINSTAHP